MLYFSRSREKFSFYSHEIETLVNASPAPLLPPSSDLPSPSSCLIVSDKSQQSTTPYPPFLKHQKHFKALSSMFVHWPKERGWRNTKQWKEKSDKSANQPLPSKTAKKYKYNRRYKINTKEYKRWWKEKSVELMGNQLLPPDGILLRT